MTPILRQIIYRPVAILTITVGLIALALFFGRTVPISLLPDVPIPTITVNVSAPDLTARVIENTITRPLRNQLLQVNNLEDLQSSSRNGSSFLELKLQYGTNTDLAYIEVNEKVDRAMNILPKELARPRVVQSSLADIPVFYLAMTPVDQEAVDQLQLSEFAEKVIKRRLEQVNEIAFVDLHGIAVPRINIYPNNELLASANIDLPIIEQTILQNNLEIGNVLIRDGQYQYAISLNDRLRSTRDMENLFFTVEDQTYRLGDVARIVLESEEKRGSYLYNDDSGILFSVRKKNTANNFTLLKTVDTLLSDFSSAYPNLSFNKVNDQSQLLEISYQNLRTSLLYGLLFASIILFLFFREWKLPLLIMLTLPVSLLLSLLAFKIIGITINIISLSGLILGVGLMIDNAIIIIDNIRQEMAQKSLPDAVVVGTGEVIRPLISSALTTISVFFPLILISGLAGALFYDQAVSITISLTTSLLVSALLLPTLAFRLSKEDKKHEESDHHGHHRLIYHFLKNKWLYFILFLLVSGIGIFLSIQVPQSSFPAITTTALEAKIDWNENLSIGTSEERLTTFGESQTFQAISAIIGEKQFLLENEETSTNEASLIMNLASNVSAASAIEETRAYFSSHHPQAEVAVYPLKNTFDYLFAGSEEPLIAIIQPINRITIPPPADMEPIYVHLQKLNPSFTAPPTDDYLLLQVREDRLGRYGIDYNTLISYLRSLLGANYISDLKASDRIIPIYLTDVRRSEDLASILAGAQVVNRNGQRIPIQQLVEVQNSSYYKQIYATNTGESLMAPLGTYQENKEISLQSFLQGLKNYRVYFTGQHYESKALIQELIWILIIVLLLLYLILAAQFESLWQPLLVLIDVPLSIVGGIMALTFFNATLNIVSMVGIIIMAGIIVNDAILKIDMINKNRKSGMSIDLAIAEASSRRLRPIIMTSLTTILAFLPVLFAGGIGAEIQRPLALTVVGGLLVGTLSSLIFLPVLYRIFHLKAR